jgi:hypothetical protein
MKARNEEIGTGAEGVGSKRARVGGDRGGSAGQGDSARTREAERADAELVMRKRTDGSGFRGSRASKSRNAIGRTGPRNTGRRTSAAEAGTRKGLQATINRLKKRSTRGTTATGTRATTRRPAAPGTRTGNSGSNRTTAKTARGTAASRGRAGARSSAAGASRAGLRTRSGARKAGKTTKR